MAGLVAGGKPLLISPCMNFRGSKEAGDVTCGWPATLNGADFSGQQVLLSKISVQSEESVWLFPGFFVSSLQGPVTPETR